MTREEENLDLIKNALIVIARAFEKGEWQGLEDKVREILFDIK